MNSVPLYSVQVPIRGPQEVYQRVVDNLRKQTCQNFELIVCDDCCDRKPLIPIKTTFKHRLVRIPSRPPGWGYCVARNACFNNCTRQTPYMVYLDSDWMITPESLENVRYLLGPDRILQGWKHYAAQGRKYKWTVVYPEFAIIPLDAILLCGGMDEIFFPHYSGYWHDLMRRIQMIKPMKIIPTRKLFAIDVGSSVVYNRNANDGKDVLKRVTKLNKVNPIRRNLLRVEVVYENGYAT